MDLTGGDNDGLIQAKGSPRIPRRKKGRRGTQYHQNNSVGHSSHRSSSRSSLKRRSGTDVHNTAGRRRAAQDIYSDDSPNHRGSSGNSRGRMPLTQKMIAVTLLVLVQQHKPVMMIYNNKNSVENVKRERSNSNLTRRGRRNN